MPPSFLYARYSPYAVEYVNFDQELHVRSTKDEKGGLGKAFEKIK